MTNKIGELMRAHGWKKSTHRVAGKVVKGYENGTVTTVTTVTERTVAESESVSLVTKPDTEGTKECVNCKSTGKTPSLESTCFRCLRYGPRDRYCGHKLRVIKEDEGMICTGKGFSDKHGIWKELIN